MFWHQVTRYLLTTAVEVCTARSFVHFSVRATISHLCFTPSSARVQSVYAAHLMCVGGERNLSRLESPQKPLRDSQSYESKEKQLVCVCSSVRLNPNTGWKFGLVTKVQLLWFCAVGALGCQYYCCPWQSALLCCYYTGVGQVEQWWTQFFPPVLQWY